ncbi:conserved membrane hypothetical protein [Capnocytophaga canimorsus]|uniref:Protoporphyrinogen IX oxidase n=1 Tax=Capnocytophaga canimorsus TaxID=28188 RepID=A0A0B7H4Q4_9FLAO|nr:hypothetical protein [Capnocytophaga canimorsus]CEN34601.1 conserved membrane hypothetical protein [Capnocytophaga canimorsus]
METYQWFTLARIIHVLAVVIWIGGVAMVTMVIIPAIKKMKRKEEQLQTFEQIEGRFAKIAKITTLLTAFSGFYMIYITDTWYRYADLQFWWLHAMTLIWFIFYLDFVCLRAFRFASIVSQIYGKKSCQNFSNNAQSSLVFVDY